MLADATKHRIFEAIDGKDVRTKAERAFVLGMSTLIVLNVVAVVLETEPALYRSHEEAFAWFETFSVVVFTIEYLLRVITCTGVAEFRGALLGRLKFISRPLSLVDLLAILPFYLPLLPVDLRILRLFRFARFLRVLKLGRYSESLRTLSPICLW
jgi:voltage-gated potassium channel